MTNHGNHEAGSIDELKEMLHEFNVAILTTRGADGHFHARPMALQKKHLSLDELWFPTWSDSSKVQELRHEPLCSVALHATDRGPSYVSLSGHGELVSDPRKIHDLWEPAWKAWFPDGPASKGLALIRFVPEHAEYMHPTGGGRLRVLATLLRQLAGGRHATTPPKEVELHS